MAFPGIPTSAGGRILSTPQADTTAARTFPSLSSLTKNAGDRLIAIAVAYQTSTGTNAAFSSWGGGFTEIADRATSTTMAIGIAEKISTGSETGTFTVTQAGTITGHCQLILLSISGAHASTPIEVSTKVNGTSSNATPSQLDPTGWGTEDTLWIEVIATGETSTSGSFTGVSGVSTNYGSTYTAVLTADATGGVEAAVAFRQLNAAFETPDNAFSVDTSNARHSIVTIGVRPTPAANQGSATGTITWAGTATGTTVRSGAASGSIAWVGSSTGVRSPQGAGSGSVVWAGTADGEAPVVIMDGSASGSITWSGSAQGSKVTSGAAAGTISWSGTATGEKLTSGAGAGTVVWVGSATGTTTRAGVSTGNITWAGSATGEAPGVGVQEGSADGTITWNGTATGVHVSSGAGSGAIGWGGSATGTTTRAGVSTGNITWTGTATGEETSHVFWAPAPAHYTPGNGHQSAGQGYTPAPRGYVPLSPGG